MEHDTWASAPDQPRPSARRIGPYEVMGELGRGAMGVVYRARNPQNNQQVALKVMLERATETRLKRFEREGQVTAALNHPGIVRVHAAGQVDGHPWLAYELVEDCRTLDQAFEELTLVERVELVRDAARALGHAHAAGVIHRDVKPENILVDPTNRVRVADFGLAYTEHTERLTQTGTLLGTPHYMAPEQLTGDREAIGPVTDVWALGVVLYRALTQELPFPSETLVELTAKVLEQQPVRPQSIDPQVSPQLERVCLRALEKQPGDRPSDGEALAADLDAYLAGQATSGAGRWIALVGVCLAIVVLAAILLPGSGSPQSGASDDEEQAAGTAAEPSEPAWYRDLPEGERPALPLPRGLQFGVQAGEYRNATDGSVLVWIPSGEYPVGSPNVIVNALSPRVVRVEGFFLGKHEITWEQFRTFCRLKEIAVPKDTIHRSETGETTKAGLQEPVFRVTWQEAQDYCRWAGGRLPTEIEWEAAARGRDRRNFPWGNAAPTANHLNAREPHDGHRYHTDVGSFPDGRSPFGCLDMAGNVWEWVADPLADDPKQRIKRGGSRRHYASFCTTTHRGHHPADFRDTDLGFRLCR